MRKCVSLVAMASAAVGIAACSAPDRAREPVGAAQPMSALAPAPHDTAGPPSPAAVAAHVPAARPAEGQNPPAYGIRRTPDAAPQAVTGPAPAGAGPDISAPVIAPPPSGTTVFVPRQASGGGHVASAKGAAAPPPALPAPAPPPVEDHLPDHRAQSPSIGYDARAAAAAQIMGALAAARADGKAVLLDFGANWCAACRALDKAMHTPKAQAVLAQSYHVVQIDLGNADADHLRIASRYEAYGTYGMPLLIVLNPDGSVRADSARSGQPKYDEAGFTAWLRQWAPR